MRPMSAEPYLEPYRDSHEQHGASFEVTLWASRKSQLLRFEVFAAMFPLEGCRLLDAGCSRGDLAEYLTQAGIAYESYTGIDALPQVIQFARQRKLPRATFECGDFLSQPSLLGTHRPQVICISGSLNTMSQPQVHQVLTAAWAAAEEALLFNFLSDRTDRRAVPQNPPVRRFDTLAMLRWAFEQTSSVAFRQDYFPHGHDATLVMRK